MGENVWCVFANVADFFGKFAKDYTEFLEIGVEKWDYIVRHRLYLQLGYATTRTCWCCRVYVVLQVLC